VNKDDLILAHCERLEVKVDKCIKEIAELKVHASLWGGIAGAIPIFAYFLYQVL